MEASVSVVIPTYERPAFLRGAIETALGQTHEEIEVIVVDDGSSEQYASEIAGEYSDIVHCIAHEENEGLSAARNTGVRESSGDYIAFLDDDDRWHRTKIARQVQALDQNEEAGLATCLVASMTPENNLVHCERSAPSGDCSNAILVGNRIGTPSRVLVRRTAFTDIGGFDESLPTKQDWDFYLRLCQEWTIEAIQDHLCFRTVHESMSSSTEALQRDKEAIISKHEDLIRERGALSAAEAALSAEIGRSMLDSGRLREARPYLKQSITEPTLRRFVLLLLSFTSASTVERFITTKRTVSRWRGDCGGVMLNSESVPGLST